MRIVTNTLYCTAVFVFFTCRPDVVPSEENCCLVSATKATGLRPLLEKVEEAVLEATGQRLHEVLVPADGPQLRYSAVNVAKACCFCFSASRLHSINCTVSGMCGFMYSVTLPCMCIAGCIGRQRCVL